jgi:hypothetical protein
MRTTAILFALTCPIANSFTATHILKSSRSAVDGPVLRRDLESHRLCAKKPGKKNNSKKNAPSSGGGSGFGKVVVESTENKVRSVSGHRGSGEKPLRQAANTFDAIRKDHGKDATYDVYCYSPLNDEETFWFVGKIAVKPGTAATAMQAALSQKRLIFEYAKRELRPQNLGGKYASSLELWFAPGDTEMDAVQNKVSLTKVEGTTKDLLSDFSVKDVGYNPEIYVGDEVKEGGLRIKRDPSTGDPIKPVFEVNESL